MGPDSSAFINVRTPNPRQPLIRPGKSKDSCFGALPDGREVHVYALRNAHGLVCKVMGYGACITELCVPDREGKVADVVLGFARLEDYMNSDAYVGATIGRVANRIAGSRFILERKLYQLTANEGPHHLHGGVRGFDKVLWTRAPQTDGNFSSLVMTHCSPDGEEGYPGNLSAKVSYTLTDANELLLEYEAVTDKPTPVNLTNHTYFNLAGKGDVLGHSLTLNANRYTPLDEFHLPTGTIVPVARTKADFRFATRIGSRLKNNANGTNGLNYNFVLNNHPGALGFAARLNEPKTGRTLELWTDQPALQLYTGSYIRPKPSGKYGMLYGPNSGLCLEPQHFPDAVNQPQFPSVIIRPGQTYRQKTVWKFFVE